ncbi:MAG: NAD(P)H-dependent oxidoreductase [Blautia sp.]|nr:NAD(P)H-dependent oxidoreductase [Blautia sp.]MDY5032584.1 NAD(P)H-dependent oxidoreductase [Blautia sp.]
MEWILIWPKYKEEKRLEAVVEYALNGTIPAMQIREPEMLEQMASRGELQNKRILFAAALGSSGINLKLYTMMEILRMHPGCLRGSVAGILVDGSGEYYTKAVGREVVQAANQAGCWFVGRPLTEGTGSLQNYKVIASNQKCSLYEAYLWSARDLAERILSFERPKKKQARLLCVHSCNPETSNTLQLWKEIKGKLSDRITVREISLRNGTVSDCAGCPYDMCMYFSRNSSCFYGGPMVEEVYPALEVCDGLILLCPNYNDALGANLTAFINRLTALFRKKPFADKCLFALIVSGYSGGDILARQLIDGLNMNKSFILPGDFALMETANTPGSIMEIREIHKITSDFASHISSCMGLEQKNRLTHNY